MCMRLGLVFVLAFISAPGKVCIFLVSKLTSRGIKHEKNIAKVDKNSLPARK